MSQSFVQIYVHIVFHTKDNLKLIKEDIENELSLIWAEFLRTINQSRYKLENLRPYSLLCTLPKTMAPADLAEEVKKSSSKWIKTKGVHYSNFYWQDGYGGFSVSNSGVDAVRRYILNQRKHHEKVSFMEEYKNLLEAYGIPHEDRYL